MTGAIHGRELPGASMANPLSPSPVEPPGDGPITAVDPVCGMTVDTRTAKHRAAHDGRAYFFCSANCKAKFEHNPANYLTTKAAAVPVVAIPIPFDPGGA